MNKTLLIGLGAQKTGTTWMHTSLSKNPEYDPWFSGEWKIWKYFLQPKQRERILKSMNAHMKARCADMHVLPRKSATWQNRINVIENIEVSIHEKFSDFATNSPCSVLGDLTPANGVLTSNNLKTIKELASQYSLRTKFVFRMRDPLSRVTSATFQAMKRAALDQQQDFQKFAREEDPNQFMRKTKVWREIFKRTDYEKTYRAVEQIAAEDEIFTIFVEEDGFTQKGFDKLCRFAGIHPSQKTTSPTNESPIKIQINEESKSWVVNELRHVYDFARCKFGTKIDCLWADSIQRLQ